jgi:pimeloyl-ACP methyl ester carboxylesterase
MSYKAPARSVGRLKRPFGDLYYEVSGSGPALLFAHGLGGNHLSWWQQVAHFAPHYTCVSFAHRGFAPSSAIDGGPDPADYASDLAALIDHLKFPDVRLVGQSMGGWTVLEYAIAHPAMGMAAAARSPALHLLYASIDTMAGALDKAKVREGLRRTAHRTVTELKDFRVPTLLIAGGEDVVYPPFLASAIATALPCGQAHLIPHAGHSPYFEEAATFNGLVEAFLARQR